MLKLFQRDILIQVLLILVALLLLWGRALLAPQPMVAGDHPAVLYGLICSWLESVPRLAVVIAMLLVLTEGIVLNLILANVNLVSQTSLLPTLLYVIALSVGATTLTPVILVSGVAIASLHHLMLHGTLLTIRPEKICAATLLIGLATFFYQPAILLLLSYLLIATNYRLYNWRDWLLMILGFAAPYVLLLLVLYLTDGILPWWESTLESLSFHFHPTELTVGILPTVLLVAVFLWSIVNVLSHVSERPVLWQKNATTVMLFTLGGIGMMVYSHGADAVIARPWSVALAFLAIPFAFVTYRLLVSASEKHTGFGRHKRHTWIYDLLLILILIAALLC